MTNLPERAGRRCHNVLNPLHSTIYFAPEMGEELAAHGLEDRPAVYFAGRAAPLGAVGAGTVTATFFSFDHALVAAHVPAVWERVSPETVLAARPRVAGAVLRRLLGDEAVESPEMAEAAQLALRATEGGSRAGRPLYAANADLPVPQAPHEALWHAATLLREHRGDAHIAALQCAGLDPVEAVFSHSAGAHGPDPEWTRALHGHGEADWAAAGERLRGRGLVDAEGALTERGTALRNELEEETDRLDAGPYELLGAEGVARLTELATRFASAAHAAGGFPAAVVKQK